MDVNLEKFLIIAIFTSKNCHTDKDRTFKKRFLAKKIENFF